jgi:hypothetical protein
MSADTGNVAQEPRSSPGEHKTIPGDHVRFCHFGDIHAARFNVWFRALFGHQRVARLCRRMTHSGHGAG